MLIKRSQKIITLLLIFAVVFSQVVAPFTAKAEEKLEPPTPVDSGEKGPGPGDMTSKMADTPTIQQTGSNQNQSGPAQSVSLFQTDLFSGKASTSVPIAIPAGRAGMQPSIALGYTSSNENGLAGVGWGFGLGLVQRDERRGLTDPEYYGSKDSFIVNFAGASGKLVRVSDYITDGGGYYAFKLESDPSSMDIYYHPDQYWRFHDKSGNDYYFGQNYNASNPNKISRQAHPDNVSFIYAWYLEKVVDVNGNYYEAEYQKTTDNQIKLTRINYTGNTVKGDQPAYSVQFAYETRADKSINYKLGYKQIISERLSNVLVQYGQQNISLYQLNYDPSPQTNRSLLKRVNVYSRNGANWEELTKPVEFEYKNNSKSWVEDNSQILPTAIFKSNYQYIKDQGVRFADLNGDGLIDVIKSYRPAGTDETGPEYGNYYQIWIKNKNGGWDSNETMRTNLRDILAGTVGSLFAGWTGYNNSDYGLRLIDINGDNKADLVAARAGSISIWINNGNGWARDPNWQMPYYFTDWSNSQCCGYTDQGLRFGDVNGDGRVDLIQGLTHDGGGSWFHVWLNTGSGWSENSTWTNKYINNIGVPFISWQQNGPQWDQGLQLVDVNGDGLADFIRGLNDKQGTEYREVWLNNGSGWIKANYSLPSCFIGWWSYSLDQGMRMGDVNSDGLLDLIRTYDYQGLKRDVWLNNGAGWTRDTSWSASIPIDFVNWTGATQYNGVELLDINSDGSMDFVQGYNSTIRSWANQSTNADLLAKITNSLGGVSEIDYMSTSTFDNNDTSGVPKMPFITQVVKSITNSTSYLTESGTNSFSYKTEYSYEKGYYNTTKREFWGFGIVTVKDAQNRFSKTFFKQDESDGIFKGRIAKTESYDGSGQLFNTITNNWVSVGKFANKVYDKLLESSVTDYRDINSEGGGGVKQTKVAYEYDSYANPTRVISYGDTSISNDEKVVVNEYNLTTAKILNLVKTTKVYGLLNYNTNNDVIKKSEYYYDYSDSLDATPQQGLLTKQIVSNNIGDNPVTRIEYDDWGNAKKTLDAKNIPIEIEYENTLHQYPVKIKQKVNDTLTLETTTTYDLARGLALSSTDANGLTSRSEYDSLGRVIKQFKPTDTTNPTVKNEYILNNGIPRTVQYTLNTDGNYIDSKTYYDGLGRTIASISLGVDKPDGSKRYIVSGRVGHDNLGRADYQYPSYSVDNYSDSVISSIPASSSNTKTVVEYDYMDRVKKTYFAPGTVDEVQSYNIYRIRTGLLPTDTYWETVTLMRKPSESTWTHKTWSFYNAYQQLVKVQELNVDGSVYSTTKYEYDAADNLVSVTDNKLNKTQLFYDALGRKTRMIDPDMGEWKYYYDINGNLTKQIDAKSQTVEMQYDNLNRLTNKVAKNSAGATDKTVNYFYDTYQNASCRVNNSYTNSSYGSLCATSDGVTTTKFWFDELGREVKNQKTLDGQTYEIQKVYDSLDRLIKVIQPENPKNNIENKNDEIYYTYFNIGAIKTITGKENGQSKIYVADVTYNERGQKEKITYGNGTNTTYSYNPNNQLLNNLITADSSGVRKLQDLFYDFDKIGNVSKITDNLDNSRTQNYQYDNLNRLTQAKGSYGTIGYTYDEIGNLTAKGSTQYTYGDGTAGPHALTGKTEGGQTSNYGYDANGNMTNRNGDTLVYDSENHMTSAQYTDNSPKITVELKKGWNFFALPIDSTNKNISSILSSLKIGEDYDQISQWNPNTQQYEHYANLGGDSFTALEYGRGYAINVLKDSVTLTFEDDIKVQTTSKNLKNGWNVIGSVITDNQTKEQFLAEIANSSGAQVFRYNPESFAWEFCGRDFNEIEPGKGYAVYLPQDTTRNIVVTASTSKKTTDFTYDENGGRIKKASSGTTNIYLGPSFELEKTSSTTKVTQNIFEGDNRIVSSNDGTDYWYHQNHLGSTDVMTDVTGQDAKTRVEYYPYGQTFKQTGDTTLTKYLYTGKELDNSTELYYYGARYYDPGLQRFTQADTIVPSPSDPQSFNRYAYAANNPIIYTDPSGHFIIAAAVLWGALIGGASAAATGGNIIQGIIGGAISGAIFSYIGGLHLSGINAAGAHLLGGALSGGINAAMAGGNIMQGMVNGAVSAGVSKLLGSDKIGIKDYFGRAGIGALSGGITALAMGGDFAEGAKMGFITSSIAYVCNDVKDYLEYKKIQKYVDANGGPAVAKNKVTEEYERMQRSLEKDLTGVAIKDAKDLYKGLKSGKISLPLEIIEKIDTILAKCLIIMSYKQTLNNIDWYMKARHIYQHYDQNPKLRYDLVPIEIKSERDYSPEFNKINAAYHINYP
ncbi:MAG: hypothetical protein ACD_58C00304G0002 [uncultured bacterium]|nr:MAG: hypothetical protein ACD_58C00304G0002 [uncultured bacterium]